MRQRQDRLYENMVMCLMLMACFLNYLLTFIFYKWTRVINVFFSWEEKLRGDYASIDWQTAYRRFVKGLRL